MTRRLYKDAIVPMLNERFLAEAFIEQPRAPIVQPYASIVQSYAEARDLWATMNRRIDELLYELRNERKVQEALRAKNRELMTSQRDLLEQLCEYSTSNERAVSRSQRLVDSALSVCDKLETLIDEVPGWADDLWDDYRACRHEAMALKKQRVEQVEKETLERPI